MHILTDFPFQLVVASNLFAWNFPKKSRFALRQLVFLPLLIIYEVGTSTYGYHILQNPILDESILLIPVSYIFCGLLFCYKCSVSEAILCTASAHPAQNLVYNLSRVVFLLTGVEEDRLPAMFIALAVMVAAYAVLYQRFAVRMSDILGFGLPQGRLLINAVIVMLFVVYLYPMIPEKNLTVLFIFIVGDILALIMQFGFFTESALERKYQVVEELLRAEQKRQRLITENTEIINRKCHDLKHQVAALRQMGDGPERQKYIKEIESAVMIYESAIRTGCETLDLLMMEKLLFCEEHNIKLTCVADGTLISWMDTMDIYSLFGNALDNAIESVMQEKDKAHRIISFRISSNRSFVIVHFENYVSHEIILRNGLPVTSKEDQDYHGFGLLSIQHVTEKYGGTMSVMTEENLFCLNLIFPQKPAA